MKSGSHARYFVIFPKRTSIQGSNNNQTAKLNDENPMFRERKEVDIEEQNNNGLNRKYPYPSSFLPDFIFQNTAPHPYFIFYNLNIIFNQTTDGNIIEPKIPQKSIISQLNDYFGGIDILSLAQLKVDLVKVSDTWNKRFPEAKSFLFVPIQDDKFEVSSVPDLQSLHLLGFSLNICIFILFYIGEKNLYNMKLGPDNSDNDVHFMVFYNVDKSKIELKPKNVNDNGNNSQRITIYRNKKWLTFQRVEMGYISNESLEVDTSYFKKSDSNAKGKILFLDIDKREKIPFIKIPFLKSDKCFEKVFLHWVQSEDKPSHLTVSLTTQNVKIKIESNKKEQAKLIKIKSIATCTSEPGSRTSTKEKTDDYNLEGLTENNEIIIAETNDSAYFVIEKRCDQSFPTKFEDNLKKKRLTFCGPISKENIKESIISFRDRLKHPLTYGDVLNSNHPFMNILCYYNILNIMISSSDYIDKKIERDTTYDSEFKIRIVPIESDGPYVDYKQHNKQEIFDILKYFEVNNELGLPWKRMIEQYPQILSLGKDDSEAKMYLRQEDIKSKEKYQGFESMYYDFWLNLAWKMAPLCRNLTNIYQPICNSAIEEFLNSTIGLNPIICPIIYDEYMETSKTCCLSYFSSIDYIDPVNELLMRDVKSTDEFLLRTTNPNLFANKTVVEENCKNGAFPIKYQTLLTRLENKRNQQTPDPSFRFRPSIDLERIIEGTELEIKKSAPNYNYSFYRINEGNVILVSQFTISSKYKLSYIYVSGNMVFAVSNNNNNQFVYGHCKALDTEISFYKPYKGEFIAAVYIEEDACLIICYKFNNEYHFTGYDVNGQINDVLFPDIQIKSLVVLSRTYFASFDGKKNKINKKGDGVCVFKYNAVERIVEYHQFSDLWRINDKSIFTEILEEKAKNNSMCFIGSRFDFGENNDKSSFCVYKYNEEKYLFEGISKNKKFKPVLNFHLNIQVDNNNDGQDLENEENKLLDNRISSYNGRSNENSYIRSMLSCVPLQPPPSSPPPKKKKSKSFTLFKLSCSLTELYPSIIVTKGSVVYCDSNDLFSLYRCDPKVYRIISHQIWGFYVNTISRLSLFSTERLLSNYQFDNLNIALIVDTSGQGSHLSNLLFGTRFDKHLVLEDDIWTGCSYSGNLASIILLFCVKDVENIYNAIQMRMNINNRDQKVSIFVCQNDGVKNTIKFSDDPKIIVAGANSKVGTIKEEIKFVNDNEFEDNVHKFRNLLKGSFSDSKTAINFAKEIVTQYLACGTFAHYPLQTIENYSKEEITDIYTNYDEDIHDEDFLLEEFFNWQLIPQTQ